MITLYNHNIWNKNPSWYRNTLVRSLVEDCDADICTFQECGPATNRVGMIPIQKLMNDKYVEACPEKSDVNFTPVFYKKDKFNLLDNGYLLYGGRDRSNSKGYTWALLESKETGFKFAVISTHFWWRFDCEEDSLDRVENAKKLKAVCDMIVEKYNVPIIIGGDFNNGLHSEQGDLAYREMLKMGFRDIRLTAEETTDCLTEHHYPVIDEDEIFHEGDMPYCTIDYIFTYGPCEIKAKKFEVLTTKKALSSSDHCPLIGLFDAE